MIELINILFSDRQQAHIFHLKTKLYAQHVALGDFYETILDITDTLAETYQGKYGILTGYEININENTKVIEHFTTSVLQIESNRYNWVNKNDLELQKTIDDIIAEYYHLLYKLKNLQ